MHEEYALQLDTPIAKVRAPKKSFASKLLIILIITVTAIAIVLSCFSIILFSVFQYVFLGIFLPFADLLAKILYTILPPVLALTLPVAVLIAAKIKKPTFAMVLFFVSLGFLAVQLLSACICFILSFTYHDFSYYIYNFFSHIRGSEILSSLVSTIRNLLYLPIDLNYGQAIIGSLIFMCNSVINVFEELLFIVKNVLCAVLCLVLMKKR